MRHLHEVFLCLCLIHRKSRDEHLTEVYIYLHVHIVHRHFIAHASTNGDSNVGFGKFACYLHFHIALGINALIVLSVDGDGGSVGHTCREEYILVDNDLGFYHLKVEVLTSVCLPTVQAILCARGRVVAEEIVALSISGAEGICLLAFNLGNGKLACRRGL